MKNDTLENSKYYYECCRCDYKTIFTSDIKRHLSKKKICNNTKNINLENINEMIDLSLKKIYNKDDYLINNNNESILDLKDNNFVCTHCKIKFSTKQSLFRHENTCKNNLNIIKEQLNNLLKKENNKNDNKQFNNINKLNDKKLIPFFDKFDVSHIDNDTKIGLLLSHSYNDTFYEIMKNPNNHNFILDISQKNNQIYKNENEKIILIDNIIIYNNIWKKIKDYLIESLDSLKEKYSKIDTFLYNHLYNQIINKYNEFIKGNNKEYNDTVMNIINQSSVKYKKDIQQKFNKLIL